MSWRFDDNWSLRGALSLPDLLAAVRSRIFGLTEQHEGQRPSETLLLHLPDLIPAPAPMPEIIGDTHLPWLRMPLLPGFRFPSPLLPLGTPADDQIVGDENRNFLFGRGGDDDLTGLGGPDLLVGGPGEDTFHYESASESSGSSFDRIIRFQPSSDMIDLPVVISGISETVDTGSLSRISFDAGLADALGSARLGAGEAVLFRPDEGSFSGSTFLVIDGNGEAGYQADEDYVIQLLGSSARDMVLTTDIFI